MDKKCGHLILVSFASSYCHEHIYKTLKKLGFEIDVVDNHVWLENSSPQCEDPTILLLGQDPVFKSRILPVVKHSQNIPLLGISCCGGASWHKEVFQFCKDSIHWRHHDASLVNRIFNAGSRQTSGNGNGHSEIDSIHPHLIGRSPSFLHITSLVKKIAVLDAPVLVLGETGTGKERIAQAIHDLSLRKDKMFVPVNCGAIPDSLFESQIFGHRKGAFTGAAEEQPGLIQQASKGTLFMDEIGALSLKAQVALLRFLQDQRFRPLGGQKVLQADVRLIAATNEDLWKMAEQGKFRADLLYRLDIISLTLPPLRERSDDIHLLADHFLKNYCAFYKIVKHGFDVDSLIWLHQYNWPGNIRELDNVVHRGFVMSEGPIVHLEQCLPAENNGSDGIPQTKIYDPLGMTFNEAKDHVMSAFVERYLNHLIAKTNGNISHAAKLAGKDRSAFRKLLKKYQITKKN